jgi:prolyl 4-hydroxylase
MPLSLKVLSCAPHVLEVQTFLSPVEVQHLIDITSEVKGNVIMERSTVSAKSYNREPNQQGQRSKSNARSSTNGWIHREQDVIVDTIFRRIADLLNIDEQLMSDQYYSDIKYQHDKWLPKHDRIVEAMQLVRYGPGEEYSAHHDFTYPSIVNRYQPKRYATVLLYLTGEGDVVKNGVRVSDDNKSDSMKDKGLEGGETTFPRAITTDYHDGIKVKCSAGKAVLFYNVLPDGNMVDLSKHAGGRVEKGVKFLANVWVWYPIVN